MYYLLDAKWLLANPLMVPFSRNVSASSRRTIALHFVALSSASWSAVLTDDGAAETDIPRSAGEMEYRGAPTLSAATAYRKQLVVKWHVALTALGSKTFAYAGRALQQNHQWSSWKWVSDTNIFLYSYHYRRSHHFLQTGSTSGLSRDLESDSCLYLAIQAGRADLHPNSLH